jgi:hypothetical protein
MWSRTNRTLNELNGSSGWPATENAIARLRDLDEPAHMTLLSDLQAFRDRLADDLGR